MTDIGTWLGKQLDEDERDANVVTEGAGSWTEAEWLSRGSSVAFASFSADDECVAAQAFPLEPMAPVGASIATHIARHDPARVLREVAAKRRILTEHEHVAATEPSTHGFGCKICAYDRGDCVQYGWGWCNTVRLMTDAYANRDGYDPTWAVAASA